MSEIANKPKQRGNPAWVKGGPSPNPNGRATISPEVRAALELDTMEHYTEAKRLIEAAEKTGDLKTALSGRLALLKKTIPDATELVISIPDGLTVRTLRVDPRKLNDEQLAAVHAAQLTAVEP